MLLVLCYVVAALAFGGYTTYLLATALPQPLLDRASHHGCFAGLSDDPPTAVSDTKSGTASDTSTPSPVSDDNASRC